VIGALLGLRYRYYGAVVPNTYLAKPSALLFELRSLPLRVAPVDAVYRVLAYDPLRGPLDRVGGIGVLFCAVAALAMAPRSITLFSCAAVTAAGALFLAYAPPDWMPADRFAVPFAFPLLVCASSGLHAL